MGGGGTIIIGGDKFRAAFNFIVMNPLIEGGDKVITDQGGVTKYGVAQRFHPGVDVANLSEEQAAEIHYKEYWVPAGCEDLPWDIALCKYDCAVNQGVAVAISLGHHWQSSIAFMAARAVRYGKMGPSFEKDKEGWEIRLFRVFARALQGP